MKIYTKTGDKGLTGLIGGTRIPKNDVRIEAYGTVDELNAQIGYLISYHLPQKEEEYLQEIQNLLFNIGANLATDTTKVAPEMRLSIHQEDVTKIESEIDRLYDQLPPLSNFILPGGSREGAVCHICRTISRRAERRILDLAQSHEIDNLTLIYINRLSDYFFALSRYLTLQNQGKEIYWKK